MKFGAKILQGLGPRLLRHAVPAAIVVAALLAITLAAVAIDVRTRVSVAAFGWIYLLVILPVTVRGGRGAGLLTAAASLFLLLTFLTEPRGLPYTKYGVDVIRLAISSLGVIIAIVLIDQVNRRLASSDRLLAEIVESSEGAVTGESVGGLILSWSPGAEQLYGFSADEAIGRPVEALMPPDQRHELISLVERLQLGERIVDFETKRLTKDGRLLELVLNISPLRDADGRLIGGRTVGRDVTALRRVAGVLRTNETALRRAVEELSEGALLLDERGRVVLANEQARRYFGGDPGTYAQLFDARFALHPQVTWQGVARASFSSFLALGTEGAPARLRVEVNRIDAAQHGAPPLLLMTLRDAAQQLQGAYLQLLQSRQPARALPAAVFAPFNKDDSGKDGSGKNGSGPSLTPREEEVLHLIASGRSNLQIAQELGITVNTIERHIANIYRKLQITSRTQATAYALHHEALIQPADQP